jgi:hypothetical protein
MKLGPCDATLAWLKVKVPHSREGERGWEPKR